MMRKYEPNPPQAKMKYPVYVLISPTELYILYVEAIDPIVGIIMMITAKE